MAESKQSSVLLHTHMPASCACIARGATAAPYTMGPSTGPRPASSEAGTFCQDGQIAG